MSKTKPKPAAVDKAFTDSDKHTLGDLKLFPWTPDRIIAAQDLGMIQPNLSREGWAQWRRTQLYPGAVKDTIIFVYLSTLDDALIGQATYDEAKKFGIKLGLHKSGSPEFRRAYVKFLQVLNEIEAAATTPKGAPGAGTEDEDLEGND